MTQEMNKEIELTEKDIEVEERGSQIVRMDDDNLDKKLANVDKAFRLIEKLQKFALNHLSSNSVVNQDGKPYIMESGVALWVGPFGIYEKDVEGTVVKDGGTQCSMKDANAFDGKIKAIIFTGIIGSKTIGVELSFEGGVYIDESKDKFHTREDFLWHAKAAKANWRGRGIKKLLGLDNVTWEKLAEHGIEMDNVTSIDRKTKKQATPEEEKMRSEITEILETHLATAKERSDKLEAVTEFQGKDGSKVPGVRNPNKLFGKRLEIAHDKLVKWDLSFKSSSNIPEEDVKW